MFLRTDAGHRKNDQYDRCANGGNADSPRFFNSVAP